MHSPFQGIATTEQKHFNALMSRVRVSVEQSYKDVKQQWISQDFPRNLKVHQSPISLLYRASVLLLNFRTCFYKGGQVGIQYQCSAPSFEEYVQDLFWFLASICKSSSVHFSATRFVSRSIFSSSHFSLANLSPISDFQLFRLHFSLFRHLTIHLRHPIDHST